HGLQALRAHLAAEQAGLLMVAADIDEIDVLGLQSGDDGVKILVALVVGFEHLLGDAGLVECLLGLIGKPLAVAGLVVEDRDVLALIGLGDVCAGNASLLVIPTTDARNIGE